MRNSSAAHMPPQCAHVLVTSPVMIPPVQFLFQQANQVNVCGWVLEASVAGPDPSLWLMVLSLSLFLLRPAALNLKRLQDMGVDRHIRDVKEGTPKGIFRDTLSPWPDQSGHGDILRCEASGRHSFCLAHITVPMQSKLWLRWLDDCRALCAALPTPIVQH